MVESKNHSCKPDCTTHFTIFFLVCGFFVGMMLYLTTYVIANEDKRVKTMQELENRSTERYLTLLDKMGAGFVRLSERLGNIEGALKVDSAPNRLTQIRSTL